MIYNTNIKTWWNTVYIQTIHAVSLSAQTQVEMKFCYLNQIYKCYRKKFIINIIDAAEGTMKLSEWWDAAVCPRCNVKHWNIRK